MKIPKEFVKSPQFIAEDLEEIVLRLHFNARALEERFNRFGKIERFFAKTGLKIYNKEKAEELKHWRNYHYYEGKMWAYIYVLENLGSPVPGLIKRLRGIKREGNNYKETKGYYSERIGHFTI